MDRERAESLRAKARTLVWTHPSSSGSPVPDDRYKEFVNGRQEFAEAARFLMNAGEPAAATEIAADAWRLWMKARDIAGGRAFLGAVLDSAAPPTAARALALYGDGLFAFWAGKPDDSLARSEAAVSIAEQVKDPRALALAYTGLSRALLRKDAARAGRMAELAREHAKAAGEAMGQAPLHLHAQACRAGGDLDRAAALFTESVALNRRIADPGMVSVDQHNLGWVEMRRGNAGAAERHFEECNRLSTSKDGYIQALTEMNLAAVALGHGRRTEGLALVASTEAILEANGMEFDADEQQELDWLREELAKPAADGAPR